MTNISAWWGTTVTGTGGTQIDATVGSWAREIHVRDFGPISWAQYRALGIQPVGEYDTAEAKPRGRMLELEVAATAAALTPGTDAMESNALDEWRNLNELFNPYDGEQYMKWTRQNAAAATITSMGIGKVVETPGARVGRPGVGPTWLSGGIVYPVKVWMPFPFFWDLTEDEDNTGEVGASAGTATVNNAGLVKCGVLFTIENMAGTITELLFENTTTGDEFTVEIATNFTDTDTIDWRHSEKQGQTTDPLDGCSNAATFVANAGGENKASMWLAPGNNSISVTRITGGGTCTVEIKNQPLYGSI